MHLGASRSLNIDPAQVARLTDTPTLETIDNETTLKTAELLQQ